MLGKEDALTGSYESMRKDQEARETRLRDWEEELHGRQSSLDKYKHELEDVWQKKRRELDDLKKNMQEELSAVISEYQARSGTKS